MKKSILFLVAIAVSICLTASACSEQDTTSTETSTQSTTDKTLKTTAVTEKPSEASLEEWQQMYIDMIKENSQYTDFALLQATDGDSPDLVFTDGKTKKYALIFKDYNPEAPLQLQVTDIGECSDDKSDDSFMYIAKNLSFYYCYVQDGTKHETVYQIGGKPVILFSGTVENGNTYLVSDSKKTAGQYRTEIMRCFDFESASKVTDYKNREEIIDDIKNKVITPVQKGTEPPSDAVNDTFDEWKKIYIDFFKSTEKSDFEEFGSTIVDVDDDGIPELFCSPFAIPGTHMAWIKDGKVKMQTIGYGAVKYISYQKLIYCSSINHGVYQDNVYTFNNHELNRVFYGTILPEANGFDNPGWYIGISHESVTEEEYNAALNEAFDMDSSQSIKSGQYVERGTIISAIENY